MQWNKFESIVLFWLWRQWIKTINSYLFFYLYIHIFFVMYFFIFYLFIFFNLHFWAGPSSAHMGWARPCQPGPVTGPSQWPGWAKKKKGTCDLFTRARTLVKVIKLPSHSVLATLNYFCFEMKMQRGRSHTCVWRSKMLLLETEDACSVDDDYRLLLPLVFLPWSLVCASLLFIFFFLCFVCSVFPGWLLLGAVGCSVSRLIAAGCCGLLCFWVPSFWVLLESLFPFFIQSPPSLCFFSLFFPLCLCFRSSLCPLHSRRWWC